MGFSFFELAARGLQRGKQQLKRIGLLGESVINGETNLLTVRQNRLFSLPERIGLPPSGRFFNNGKTVLGADQITELPDGKGRVEKVAELPLAVQRGRAENNVIMDVRLVGMRTYDEWVAPFQEAIGQLITDLICFLRRDFAGLEGLPDLIGDHIVLLLPAGEDLIFSFCQKKLVFHRARITCIGRNQLLLICLFRIHSISGTVMQALCQCLPFVQVHRDDSCGCDKFTSILLE